MGYISQCVHTYTIASDLQHALIPLLSRKYKKMDSGTQLLRDSKAVCDIIKSFSR